MKVAIASRIHPASVGGLAAYQRELASGLQSHLRIGGHFLSVSQLDLDETSLQWPARPLLSMQRWSRQHRWISHLASRQPLLRMADTLSCAFNAQASWHKAIEGADVVHFVGTGWDVIGYPLAREARRARVPFTIWPAVHPKAWGDDAFDVRLYRKANAVFCGSEHERAYLCSLGVPLEKLLICGLPPMCRRHGDGGSLRARLRIGTRPSVLFLGRRDKGKGYPALLKAWRLVLEQVPDAVLLIAGPGNLEPALIDALPPDSIRDLGCPDEELKADAYAACDIFCLPSAHESFGIVYVEAWSYAKPVICGTAPASRELVQDGVTGIWADQQPQQLASSLLRLLMNPDQRMEMGLSGLRRQLTRYTTGHMVGTHAKAWRTTFPN